MWWIALFFVAVSRCGGAVQVSVTEERKFAMLFQSVVLPCRYSSPSTQTPVVQWWYKSYCRDRTRDAFNFPESLGLQGSRLGPSSHLDCSDSSRTVRIVASGQGASMTLAEYYRGRDITIINKADLRIGELKWGDSGVYFCKVVIADDLEGKNEAQVELLVLGKVDGLDGLLPGFDMDIMPEWVFVGVVIVGSLAFLLLVGVCWCQCCPHSCCCYLRCCCCPETCCCPRHLYEAGKAAKNFPLPNMALYPPYYIPSVPTMVSVPPPSLIEPKVENNLAGVYSGYRIQPSQEQESMKVLYYVEKELAQFDPAKRAGQQSCSMSELSSLHEGEPTFHQSYQQVQRMALPSIADAHEHAQPPYHGNRHQEQHQNSWNPRSEHLERKAFGAPGRTGSLDELEEFALSYDQRGRRRDFPDHGLELRGREQYHPFREDASRHTGDPRDLHRKDPVRERSRRHRQPSPPSPRKRGDAGGRGVRAPQLGPDGRAYDDEVYLRSLLERKARRVVGGRGEEEGFHSDTPSKDSSKRSSDRYHSRSPSNRLEDEDLPPYSEKSTELPTRPVSHTHSAHGPPRNQEHKGERDKLRKVNTFLSRDSLVV